eukprot:8900191-Alexandrium_andersonii.AAC.1
MALGTREGGVGPSGGRDPEHRAGGGASCQSRCWMAHRGAGCRGREGGAGRSGLVAVAANH